MTDEGNSTSRIIGRNIAEGLQRRGVSQGELARRMDLDPSTVSLYVRGEINIGVNTLARIAELLEYTFEQLITGDFDLVRCTGGAH